MMLGIQRGKLRKTLLLLKRIMNYGFTEEELPKAPWIFRNLFFNWFFWLVYYLVFVLMDFVFRNTNEIYGERSLTIFHVLGMQFCYAFTTCTLVFFGLFFYNNFEFKLKKNLRDNLGIKIEKLEYTNINKKLNRTSLLLLNTFIVFLIYGSFVGLLFLNGLPRYFPNIKLSWIAEITFRLSAILPTIIGLYFLFLIFFIIKTLIRIPKELNAHTIVLKVTTRKKEGVFIFISKYLASLVIAIILLCLMYSIINLVYAMYFDKSYTSALFSGGFFMAISIISPLLFFFYPLNKYKTFLLEYKKLKLKPLIEKKNQLLFHILHERKFKVDKNSVGNLQMYNLLIDEIDSIQERPFHYTGLFGLISSLIIQLSTGILIQYIIAVIL